jgi:hypothetical protein
VEQAMINGAKIFSITWGSALLVFLSIVFQIGYFRPIGIAFISFLNAYDIITFVSFSFSFMLIFWWAFYLLVIRLLPERSEFDAIGDLRKLGLV